MSQLQPLELDHLAINVHYDMDRAQRIFELLGFNLTPRGFHSLGSINHLLTFDHDYLELVGLPTHTQNVRREILQSPQGIDGLVFKTANADKTYKNLRKNGVKVSDVQTFGRPVELAGKNYEARFKTTRLQAGQFEAGRIYYCQHMTPELVWRKEWQSHPNTAHAIAAMCVVSPNPNVQAKKYATLANAATRKGRHNESRVQCDNFELVFITDEQYHAVYCSHAQSSKGRNSFFGALALFASDLCEVRRYAIDASSKISGLKWNDQGDCITLSIAQYGVVIDFIQSE